MLKTLVALLTLSHVYSLSYFINDKNESVLSTVYARDRKSDEVANACINEMYPKTIYRYPINIDRNDIPCIIHCVLKKFGIMSAEGVINVTNYYKRVEAIHKSDPRVLISDVGETCAKSIGTMNLDHDICKKAKVFNDCTQLYVISIREETK